jgi:hypothetical protein
METNRSSPKDLPQDIQTALQEHGAVLRLSHMEIASGINRLLRQGIPKEVISQVVTQVVEAVSKDFSSLTCQDLYSRIETQPDAFTTEEASLRESPHTTRPPALAAFVVEEPALTAENSSVTNVQECAEISASGENLNVPVSLHDLIPALPGPAAKGNQMSASKKRSLTLDAVNQLPRYPQWPRAPFAALPRIRQSTFLVQVLLRRWVFEIKRDWIAMINAIALPETKKSFLRWPRQPIHSNFWRHTKVSLFKARRGLHQ